MQRHSNYLLEQVEIFKKELKREEVLIVKYKKQLGKLKQIEYRKKLH
ncbi:hypothetical protein VCHA54P489_450002 [Vibrio chagasii]|nr:hypothetical protein VCHA54P489_450002 [Vibrio chagasii]CAH7314236.1 hypothetical protein VCHA49P380_440003 [Vibrio chagasii]CAH7330965.1 hypothetical protein VCHA37P202_470003 [Vibrio chagasii]